MTIFDMYIIQHIPASGMGEIGISPHVVACSLNLDFYAKPKLLSKYILYNVWKTQPRPICYILLFTPNSFQYLLTISFFEHMVFFMQSQWSIYSGIIWYWEAVQDHNCDEYCDTDLVHKPPRNPKNDRTLSIRCHPKWHWWKRKLYSVK